MAAAKKKKGPLGFRFKIGGETYEYLFNNGSVPLGDQLALERHFNRPYPVLQAEGWLGSVEATVFLTWLAMRKESRHSEISLDDVITAAGDGEIEVEEIKRPSSTRGASGSPASRSS